MNIAPSKAVDAQLRRRAQRRGFLLTKSRMSLGIDNHGGYRIIDPDQNNIVLGEKFDLNEVDVTDWLDRH